MRQVSFKLLEFNIYDDNIITQDSNKYRDNREFMVQAFGINEKGETASIFLEGYTPFFYVKVDDTWNESKKSCFINEINALNLITNNHNSKILAIIGGSKIHDKIPMLRKLSEKVSYIYITGNNINFVNEYKEFFDEIKNNKAKIIYTKDGFNSSGYDKVTYVDNINYANKYLILDQIQLMIYINM